MAKSNGGAHVIEVANRVATNNTTNGITWVADNLANHQSISNNDAHAISNISGLQVALDSKVVKNEDIKVNTVGLVNMTVDHRIQVNGYVGHKLGWRDLVAPFTNSSAGAAAPSLQTLANGIRLYRFSVGDSMHVSYHVNHDYAEGTNAYHHVHWFPETAMIAGDTVTWRVYYIVAKGHNQGDSLTVTRNFFDITYTSPVGGTIAGDHIVTESSDIQAYLLKEPDTIILAEIQLLGKTFAGNVYGVQSDLHYQSDREVTVSKKPNFNV